MKFRHLVSFTHTCYLTVDYNVYFVQNKVLERCMILI